MLNTKRTLFIVFVFLFLMTLLGTDYYVDQSHQNANDNNPGTLTSPWKTITKANQTLLAGDTVFIKAGTYSSYIAPNNSGAAGTPITYRNFANESVIISNASYGISLNGKSHVVISGLDFYNLDKFIWLQNGANYNTIANCHFDQGRTIGWSGSKVYRDSRYNWIHHCRFSKYGYYDDDDVGCILDIGNEESTTDTTSHNLFEDNIFFHGGHHIVGVYGRYNVLRNNYFHNEPWSMGTAASDRGAILYGDRNLSFSGYAVNSGRNLFDGNRVAYSSDPPDNIGAAGMSMNTGYNIVRNNYFYHNDRAGLFMSLTSTYYSDIVYNKIYHNTFFHNGLNTQDPIDHGNSGIAFGLYSGTHIIKYNALKNNLLYENGKIQGPNGMAFGSYRVNLGDQIFAGNWDGDTQGDPKLENAEPVLGDPFNMILPDLRIKSDSPCRDQGVALTTIVSATGSGTSFQVADAGYFMDGWGIEHVSGDELQLIGTSQRARIILVNYTNNTLSVDTALNWTQGQGVALAYIGPAPDIGAYEFPASGPYLQINSPNGSEVWHKGEQRTITWTANEITGNLIIELLQNDAVVGTIASSVEASAGTFNWIVGKLADDSFVTGQNLKIRIRTVDGQTLAERSLR